MQKWWKGLLFMAGHEAQQDEGGRYHEDVRDGLEQVC